MFEKKYDIKLDQDSYYIGEKVTGRVDLLTDKGINAQNFVFYVYGQEETKFVRVRGNHPVEYSYNDIFFTKDLTSFFESKGLLKSGKLDVPNDVREIPFEFIIPTNALESYNGKHVKITYWIHLYANKKWGAPIEKKKNFIVMGPLRTVSTGALKTVSASSNIIKEMYLDGIGLKLELEKNAISPGQTLNGKLCIENSYNQDIRGVKVMLIGYEYVIGSPDAWFKRKKDDLEYTEELELYNSNIEWKREDEIMNFEIFIPENAKRSYLGKYSKYFWSVDVKFDIPWGRDIHGKQEIEIH